MNGDVIQALVVTVLPLVVIWRGARRVRAGDLVRWAARFGVVIGDESRDLVLTILERGRRIRAAGAAVGLVVAGLPAYLNLINAERASDFSGPINGLAWVYGAAMGTTLAETLIVQRPRDRRATLEARRWTDYVPSSPVVWTAVATVCGIVGAITAVVRDTSRSGEAVGAAVACLVAGACLAVGLNRIVDRARLATVGPDRDLDESRGADGAHRHAGAAQANAGTRAAAARSVGVWVGLPPIAHVR
ncbi:MAG: hypothetical protein ACT452_06070, partial [Microthrixaceae bacterium]